MKKITILSFLTSSMIFANSQFSTTYTFRDYDNSKTKIDGNVIDYNFKQKFENLRLEINYEDGFTKRENKVTNQNLETLKVEKIALKSNIKINEIFDTKFSYLKIDDNLSPTDDGKIYSTGLNYYFSNDINIKGDLYLSDYNDFNVNQYDLTLFKKFNINDFNFVAQSGIKIIEINGSNYGNYKFEDKNYEVLNLGLISRYKTYYLNFNALFGDRLFTVLNDGMKVQHHAMLQKNLYAISFGKKFGNLDIFTSYNYQCGEELPENQNDVKTKSYTLGLSYKF